LSPEAAAGVAALLGSHDSPVSVFMWADEIRSERRDTVRWHFVNIPREAASYVVARDCHPTAHGDCVVAAIERMRSVLANRRAPVGARAEALRFLVHLVADIHQPLHCSDDQDRGGNQVVRRRMATGWPSSSGFRT
jgi:nuclease S1